MTLVTCDPNVCVSCDQSVCNLELDRKVVFVSFVH